MTKKEIIKEFESFWGGFIEEDFISGHLKKRMRFFLSQAIDQYGKREEINPEALKQTKDMWFRMGKEKGKKEERLKIIGIIEINKIIQGKRGSEEYTRKYVLDIHNHALNDIIQAIKK